jgi:hypothetical protein
MHQFWQKEFSAEIVGVSGDVIECIVENLSQARGQLQHSNITDEMY